MHISRVNGNASINTWIWSEWHEQIMNNGDEIIASEINKVVIIELIFEVCPQLVVQFWNGYILYGWKWPLLPSVNFGFSVFMMLTVSYHFIHYLFIEKLDFKDVPKFDIIGGMRSTNSSPSHDYQQTGVGIEIVVGSSDAYQTETDSNVIEKVDITDDIQKCSDIELVQFC